MLLQREMNPEEGGAEGAKCASAMSAVQAVPGFIGNQEKAPLVSYLETMQGITRNGS